MKALPQRKLGGGIFGLPTLKISTPSAQRRLEEGQEGDGGSGKERGAQKGQREGEQKE